MSIRQLTRKMDALEKRAQVRETDDQELIQLAVRGLSAENLDLLIGAALAKRQGRPETKAETGARRVYEDALRQANRSMVIRVPDLPELIGQAAIRRVSIEDLIESVEGLRNALHGEPPSERQAAAMRVCSRTLEGQYLLVGMDPEAELSSVVRDTTRVYLIVKALAQNEPPCSVGG
jgi:hypothetical protein